MSYELIYSKKLHTIKKINYNTCEITLNVYRPYLENY